MLTVEITKNIIAKLDEEFDSHCFIRGILKDYPSEYARMLLDYNSVRNTNAQIANFLRYNATELDIMELPDKSPSLDLFLENTENAHWQKVKQ